MPLRTLRYPLRLPPDRERCGECIRTRIAALPGVRSARAVDSAIELEYDPDLVSLAAVNRHLLQAGACLEESVAQLTFTLAGMNSPRSEQLVQSVLNALPGVQASASYASRTLRLELDRRSCALPEVVRKLEHLGMSVQPYEGPGKPAPTPIWKLALREPDLLTAAVGGVCLLAGFLVHQADGAPGLRMALLAAAYLACGWHTAIDVVHVLRQLKFDIDVLMFAAALGAAFLGHYEEGALLLLLFALGGAGERLALSRARNAIAALSRLMPQTAIVLEEDAQTQREVHVASLRLNQRVLVPPGQRVPCDGRILAGDSALDQSPITGESIPVDRTVGDEVYAGSINGQGLLTLCVTRPASETTLAKIVRLVEEAQTTKSPTQQFTDQIEKWYVPAVLVGTVALLVVPPLLNIEPAREHASDWQGWFYQAMAFLTAASPCALAIGTPAAMLSGIARAAQLGVLIKGGIHLETLSRVRAIAFDKTGTLTLGQPRVTDVVPLEARDSASEMLALAASLEAGSRHPLAQAIFSHALSLDLTLEEASHVDQTAGRGVSGRVAGRSVRVGRPDWFDASLANHDRAVQVAHRLAEQGKTTMLVARDDQILGVIALADELRPEARELVQQLRRVGIRHVALLTGDNARTALAVSQRLGIDACHADLLPQDKLQQIRRLVEEHGRTAMVGDGVNDAPALAAATVGIALAGSSDAALETADVALLSSNLARLPHAISLSRFTRRIVVENLVIALGVIAVLAPLAALGRAPISAAVLFHEGSTVLVVLNALRILRFGVAPPQAGDVLVPG